MMTLSELKNEIPKDCKVIAVSKKQGLDKILELYEQGQKDFAENYAQELIEKQYQLRHLPDLRWHFIGQLQKNKVKHLVGHVYMIHSVGSLELAEKINEYGIKNSAPQKILLQLNLAHEPTKSGWTDKGLLDSVDALLELPGIEICGLMTLPPLFDSPESLRPFFRDLKELRDQVQTQIISCKELSMGTSHDYQVATQEGATYIRVGTLLFGERPVASIENPIDNRDHGRDE